MKGTLSETYKKRFAETYSTGKHEIFVLLLELLIYKGYRDKIFEHIQCSCVNHSCLIALSMAIFVTWVNVLFLKIKSSFSSSITYRMRGLRVLLFF